MFVFVVWMRFKSFNDRFETVFACTTNFMSSSHGIIVDGTIWSTAKNIIECTAFESFTMTELNDRFARVGKVDVMAIGSTLTRLYNSNDTDYELDLFQLLIFSRRICLVYKYKHNTNRIVMLNSHVKFVTER